MSAFDHRVRRRDDVICHTQALIDSRPDPQRVHIDIRSSLQCQWEMHEARPFFTRVESLRGIGAVMVAAWHLSGWAVNGVELLPHAPWPEVEWVQNAFGQFALVLLPAHAALMMFFVISGFVLRVSLQYGPQSVGRAAIRFHVARIFRIYPIVMVSILLAAIVHDRQATPLSLPTFIANLLLLDASLNGTLWAIQVELLMAPMIVALYFVECQYGARALIAVAIVTSALSFEGGWTPWQPLSHNFFVFILGMLVPTLGRTFVQGLSQSAVNRLLLTTVLFLFLTGPLVGFFSRFSAVIEGYLAFLLVSIVAYRTDLQALRVFDVKPIRLLGLSSGSYYVLHMPLFALIVPVVALAVPPILSLRAPALLGPAIIIILGVFLAVPSLLGYVVVEAPGIALGRLITAGFRLRPPGPNMQRLP